MSVEDTPSTIIITEEQFQSILSNPPEGIEQLCFQYRQTVANMNQAQSNHRRAEAQAKAFRDQTIKLDGTADGLKQAILSIHVAQGSHLQVVNPQ